jgi:hypothetical protein
MTKTGRTVEQNPEALLVRPAAAWRMLGCGNTFGYKLLAAGELESFQDGRARKITTASIRAYVARKLQAAGVTSAEPQPRRRGRPRKLTVPEART